MSITCENALPAGTRLNGTQEGQYEILSVLGAGGFGITYKARDHLLQSDVAIKEYLPMDLALRDTNGSTVKPRASDKTQDYDWGLERFLDEARTLSLFKTESNIVRVENFLPANGTAYMVMQYEDGESLSEYLDRQGVLDEQQLKSILFPVLDGLRAIHAEGFLHRDIKPANIYLRKNGTPILLDFGAARQALGDHSRSITGILTAGYAPFEQYSTRSNLTAATDLYALGATLYKCITGQTPVEATERINAMHNDQADPLVDAALITSNQYSDAIYESLTWLLQPLAKDRPASVEEVINKLVRDEGATSRIPLLPQENSISLPRTVSSVTNSSAATIKSSESKWASRKVAGNYKLVLIPVIAIVFLVIIVAVVLRDSPDIDNPSRVLPKPSFEQANTRSSSLISSKSSFEKAKKYYNANQYLQALPIFKKLANKDHALSEYYVSEILRNGYGVSKDPAKSAVWLKRAIEHGLISKFKAGADKGEADYQSLLGLMYFRGTGVARNYAQAIIWVRKAAKQGYAKAQLNLGYMYEKGIGVVKDFRQAANWYEKSAVQGNALAQSNIGYLYSLGRGVDKDDKQAASWYRKSANQGNANGQVNLGFMYNKGRGLKRDSEQAVMWYRKSALRGHMTAQYNLAYMYANGIGIQKNLQQAVYWYRKSALQNNASAQLVLGNSYKKGVGVDKNEKVAVEWYRKSAMLRNSSGQFSLGIMLAAGRGVSKDNKRAVYWFRKSANQGNNAGQRALGIMYEMGRGLAVDYSTALRWYNKALAGGYKSAAKDIRRVKRKQSTEGSRRRNNSDQSGSSGRGFKGLFE